MTISSGAYRLIIMSHLCDRLTFQVSAVTVDVDIKIKGETAVTKVITAPTMPPGAYAPTETDVHREKFIAVATILDIGVPPHNVGSIMRDQCSQL